VDSTFDATYVRTTGKHPFRFGYVWANAPTSAMYTPSRSYQYNSKGAVNKVKRLGTGIYDVRFPKLQPAGGTFKVTAYGNDTNRCNIGSWGPNAGNTRMDVSVYCTTPAGNPVDSLYTITFANKKSSLLGVVGPTGYVWANDPTSASYSPSSTYQYDSAGGSITITRSSAGQYDVTIPTLGQNNGDVQVTSYGGGSATCQVVGWGTNGSSQQIAVDCFDTSGVLVDTQYVLQYVR
jgi:hypothetical protein